MPENRRDWMKRSATHLAVAGGAGVTLARAEDGPGRTPPEGKAWRVGVISARNRGKPQRINGHTWHFAQYLHPTIDLPTAQKHLDPTNQKYFEEIVRNPACDFGILPFADTRISHYYEADSKIAQLFADSFPEVKVAASVEQVLRYLDALIAVDKNLLQERAMRSLIRKRTGRNRAALADLDWFLENEPEGIDLDRVRQMRAQFD